MSSGVATANELLAYWFSPEVRKRWFNSTVAFDNTLRTKYADSYEAAGRGELDDWQQSAQGALALVILLDQIPLNIFRGKPQSFSGEAHARVVAAKALAHGFGEELDDAQKAFLYLPFMHSENLDDQDRSVELYTKAGLQNNLRYARHHREIVRRFGRFPHRNAILGRESTPEEIIWLQSKEAFKG